MTQTNPPSTSIATSKTAALSRVLDSVPKGYVYFVSGECDAEKAIGLAKKFHQRYGIGCSPAQRLTRKQKGLANALLVMYWPDYEQQSGCQSASRLSGIRAHPLVTCSASHTASDVAAALAATPGPGDGPMPILQRTTVHWLLLATQGSGAIHESEKLRNVTDKLRLQFLGYELVRRAERGKVLWTFRRPREQMREWYALLTSHLSQHREHAVAQCLQILARQPGFSGIRRQSIEIFNFVRQKHYQGEMPKLPFLQKSSHGPRLLLD